MRDQDKQAAALRESLRSATAEIVTLIDWAKGFDMPFWVAVASPEMFDRKTSSQLLGESMREIGVLAIVFIPLEAYWKEPANPLPFWLYLVLGLVFGGPFVAWGIYLQRED